MKMSGATWYRRYKDTPAVVIDVETSIKNRGEAAVGNMLASPFHPDNKVVLLGQYKIGPDITTIKPYPSGLAFSKDMLLVGHNIKFDLLYLIKESFNRRDTIKWLLNDVLIWDTMVVEYLLTGQQDKFVSLDTLSTKYGGRVKDSKIKKYWEDGVDTEDIPKKELEEYLAGDLQNTAICFIHQRELANKMSMYDLIGLEMEALKDTIITEWYGMHVDLNILHENALALNHELHDLEGNLKDFDEDINWSSPLQLQTFLFGGKVKLGTKSKPTGEVYKTGPKAGTPKFKKVVWEKEYPGYLISEFSLASPVLFGTSTDEDTLGKYLVHIADMQDKYSANWWMQERLITTILNYRKLYKDFHTYYAGIAKLVWPNDSLVHATFNHTATDTGRLSCTNPNLQNITSSE